MKNGKRLVIGLTALAVCLVPALAAVSLAQTEALDDSQAPGIAMAHQATKGKKVWITADHSLHPALQKEFKSGPEVTQACLSCHELAAGQFQKTVHWTWRDPATVESKVLGKGGLSINNF